MLKHPEMCKHLMIRRIIVG